MPTPTSILKETFGYDTFRPLQREVIENVMARRDTLAVMPTGGGREIIVYYLKPVYDKLNGTLNYDDLKILRVVYLTSHQE